VLIDDYFQNIESQIDACINIFESRLVKDKRSPHIGIIEGKLIFKDESVLHFIEFVNVKQSVIVYKYSYHYQSQQGEMLFRYDMAPHHREIQTFPQHKHINSNIVINAAAPALEQVLSEIDDLMDQTFSK